MLTDNPALLMSADDLMRVASEPPVLSMTGTVTMTNPMRLLRQGSSPLSGYDSQTEIASHNKAGPGADSATAAVTVAMKPSEQEQKPWKQERSKNAF